MKTEIDEKFEIFDEKLDSWYWGLKHYVASLLGTGVSGGYFTSFFKVLNEGEASSSLRNFCNYLRNDTTSYPTRWNRCVGIEVLLDVAVGFAVFWDVTPYSLLEIYWHFEGMFRLHHKDKRYCPDDVGITTLRKPLNLW